jgi:hypothetical protein
VQVQAGKIRRFPAAALLIDEPTPLASTHTAPADIDIAEIRGAFDAHLTVRQKRVISATGTVAGKAHYGKLVIEEGGQLSGDLEGAASAMAMAGLATKPAKSLAV